MKKSAKIAIISGIVIAIVISVLAVTVHLRLSAIEGNENTQESTSEKIKEITNSLSNPNAEQNKTSESEENESTEHLENKGK